MPAVADYPFVRTQLNDYTNEKQSVTFNVGPITALTIAGLLTQIGAFNAALAGITLGVITQEAFGVMDQVSNARAASPTAQVETRMLMGYIDAVTGAKESEIIPTADYTAFNYADPPAADFVILTGAGASAATTAWIDAVEAMAKFPGTNNAVQVTYMKIVR